MDDSSSRKKVNTNSLFGKRDVNMAEFKDILNYNYPCGFLHSTKFQRLSPSISQNSTFFTKSDRFRKVQ